VDPAVQARALEVQEILAQKSQHQRMNPACAEAHGATVLHYDRGFDRIAEVTGQPSLWVVPPGSVA